KLFNEKSGNAVLDFFAKTGNFFFSFFISIIKIKIPFTGFSRLEPEESGLLGKFNLLKFADSIFPWPVSIYKKNNEHVLQGINKADDLEDIDDSEKLKRIECWKKALFLDRSNEHISSADRLLRLVSEQTICTLLQDAFLKESSVHRVSAFKILALLTTAEPEKAVSAIHKISNNTITPNQIINLIRARINEPDQNESYDEVRILPLSEEKERLVTLLQFYENSRRDSDGCIYTGIERAVINKQFVSQVGKITAAQIQEHGSLINEALPSDLIALMDQNFEFKDKLLATTAVPVQ
ncbi:MAG: hypothetical protein ACPGEF_04690, partial [Endozoicomonas sp.]